MPGNVLTMASSVTCGHPLAGVPSTVKTASKAKLTVTGDPVLLESSVLGQKITGCGVPSGQGNVACQTVSAVANTPEPKLTVGGSPVLVEGITGTTSGTVGGLAQSKLSATANQSKLTSA